MSGSAVASEVVVRDVRGANELRACQALQRRAWGITEDGYVVPVATMAGAQKVGGLVLGAFGPDETLLGFAFAFLGQLDGRWILYSQLAAVDPAYQGSGIGRQLKFEQRRRAFEMGLERVAWAFDPLQASNAAFNLAVLGATCRRYEVDMYGERTDALNAGLATDRLLAEWSTSEDRRGAHWSTAADLLEVVDGTPRTLNAAHLHAERVRLEIPSDVRTQKREPARALAWQHHVRNAFLQAFDVGFVAVGFSRAEADRPRYLLERRA
jgi:predicted GNAT superfamily acetyltransferase